MTQIESALSGQITPEIEAVARAQQSSDKFRFGQFNGPAYAHVPSRFSIMGVARLDVKHNGNQEIGNRGSYNETVHDVQKPAISGDQMAGILHSGRTL